MKVIKYAAWAAGGLVGLVVIALVAALVIVDGAFVKSRAEAYFKEKQRNLKIEGEPKLKLFPVFSLGLGRTSVSEPAGEKVFVSFEAMELAVNVMPLLSRSVSMEVFSLAGLKANVVRRKDGSFNFADLLGKEGEREDGDPPKVRIAKIDISNAQITYLDEASGQRVDVANVNVKTGSLADDQPGPLEISASINGRKPDVALKVQVGGAAKVDLARQAFALSKLDARVSGNADTLKGLDLRVTGDLAADRRSQIYTVDGLKLEAKGMLDRDALSAAFNAPQLRVTSSKAEGQAVAGTLAVKGPGRNVDVKFRMSAVEGSASALSIPAMALEIDSRVGGDSMKGSIATPVKANLDTRVWELPKIVANLTFASPKIPQKTVTLPIAASVRADLGKQAVSTELETKFDESNIKAKFAATKLEPLAATFDLGIDKLNLDRYLPADGKGGKPDAPIDLSPLKGKTVSGKIAIGDFTAKRVKLQNVKAEIKLADGKLEVAPHSANLYGGTLSGALSADANGNRFAVKETMQNVALGALLRDAAQKDAFDGRGNLTLDLTTAGTTVPALKKALAGNARVEMKDGAVKGINLAESFRNAKSMLGSKSARSDTSKKTDFSDMSASFTIKNGVARNDDLKAASPFARLGGSGNLDIGNNGIDYLARATLANTSKGQGGAAAGDVAGITVPVKLSGALDNPDWSIDYLAVLKATGGGVGGLVGGAAGGAVDLLKKGGGATGDAAGGVKDKLRGLFGR